MKYLIKTYHFDIKILKDIFINRVMADKNKEKVAVLPNKALSSEMRNVNKKTTKSFSLCLDRLILEKKEINELIKKVNESIKNIEDNDKLKEKKKEICSISYIIYRKRCVLAILANLPTRFKKKEKLNEEDLKLINDIKENSKKAGDLITDYLLPKLFKIASISFNDDIYYRLKIINELDKVFFRPTSYWSVFARSDFQDLFKELKKDFYKFDEIFKNDFEKYLNNKEILKIFNENKELKFSNENGNKKDKDKIMEIINEIFLSEKDITSEDIFNVITENIGSIENNIGEIRIIDLF